MNNKYEIDMVDFWVKFSSDFITPVVIKGGQNKMSQSNKILLDIYYWPNSLKHNCLIFYNRSFMRMVLLTALLYPSLNLNQTSPNTNPSFLDPFESTVGFAAFSIFLPKKSTGTLSFT